MTLIDLTAVLINTCFARQPTAQRATRRLEKQPDEDPVLLDPAQNQENTPENLVDPRASPKDEQAGPGVEGEGWMKME